MDDVTQQLRSRGAIIGESNLKDWQELVLVHNMEEVLYAVVHAKVEKRKPQVTVGQVADELEYKLIGLEKAKLKIAGKSEQVAAAAVHAEDVPVHEEPAPVHEEPAPVHEEPAPVHESAPAVKKCDNRIGRRGDNYRELLTRRPGLTIDEISAELVVTRAAVENWLQRHKFELANDGKRPKHWTIVTPATIAAAATSSQAVAPPGIPAVDEHPPIVIRKPVIIAPDLDGELLPLLERLVERWSDHHDLEFFPKARVRLTRVLESLFPV